VFSFFNLPRFAYKFNIILYYPPSNLGTDCLQECYFVDQQDIPKSMFVCICCFMFHSYGDDVSGDNFEISVDYKNACYIYDYTDTHTHTHTQRVASETMLTPPHMHRTE
jgi:hypothetical protein